MRSSFVQTRCQMVSSALAWMPKRPRQGGLPGNGLHGVHIRSGVLVPHVGDGQIFPIPPVTQLRFLVPQVPVPVGVEVQQQPAGSENPRPVAVSLLRVVEIPGHVPGDQHVKAVIREHQLLRVHLEKGDLVREGARVAPGFLQHGGGIVYGGYLIAHSRQDDGEKARPRTHVQHPDGAGFSSRETGGDPLLNGASPDALLIRRQFLLIHAGVSGGAVRPVVDIFFLISSKPVHMKSSCPARL